ncbi:DUF488 domain-containing protein [Isobaculum melis]|uniref:Uncharacterized conserved protein YeaO, DUF488 family n=1 Tax=Isobaculum melis TaxID=142588 RepID=A0A1H9RRJ0_9LACT|nr:DUF488 family protein [Isobaculum melis]SER75075.1 Uncharacterized conserved protein YeaO, DUF488 family [Isobaculum melis]
MIQLKRAYDPAQESDGYRILVDRIWPRGVSKERLKLNEWNQDITPTTEIRKAFHHDPEKFTWFKAKYEAELAQNKALSEFVKTVKQQLKKGNVTFVYAAKDPIYNHVVILRDYVLNL